MNMGVGKTSLANTLKQFVDNPNQTPMPLLAGEHPGLLKTVYLTKIGEKASTIELSDKNTMEDKTGMKAKKLNLKLVDMGGHQEYYSCSTLFISSFGK